MFNVIESKIVAKKLNFISSHGNYVTYLVSYKISVKIFLDTFESFIKFKFKKPVFTPL